MPVPDDYGPSHAPEGWPSPPDRLACVDDEVHAWWIDLRAGATRDHLSADERARADRFRFPRDRERYVAAHSAVRSILAVSIGERPEGLTFATSPGGKPRLSGHPAWQFNLSHSGDVALLAVARGRSVGIDIECLRPMEDAAGIVARFFAPGERATFDATPEPSRADIFFRIWTRKEAYLKALGVGLSGGLDAFDVSPRDGVVVLPATNPGDRSFRLIGLDSGPDHRAALAVEGDDWRVHRWRFSPES